MCYVPPGAGIASRAARHAHVFLEPQFPDNTIRNWCRGGGIDGAGVAVDAGAAGADAGAGQGTGSGGRVVASGGGIVKIKGAAADGGINTYSGVGAGLPVTP